MRLKIDSESCQGHGRCALSAPDYFSLNEEGFGVVTQGLVADADGRALLAIEHAVQNCPERAITLAAC